MDERARLAAAALAQASVPERVDQDRALYEELGERREAAGREAFGLEQAARRLRNVEAGCAAAQGQLERGFAADDGEPVDVELAGPGSLRV